jgi:hypothetical protein
VKAKKTQHETSTEYADGLENFDGHDSESPDSIHDENEKYQLVERRAYELWLQRGCVDGDPLSDWLRAESEVYALIGTSVLEPNSDSKPVQRATHG